MFNAINRKVNILGTSSECHIPTSRSPNFPQLHQSLYSFLTLRRIHLSGFHILFRKAIRLFYKVILYLTIRLYIYETEHELISISFQQIADLPNTAKQDTRRDRWSHNQRIKSPDHPFLPYHFRQLPKCLHPLRNARHIRLKAFAHIVIQRELEIIMDTPPIQLMQIRQYQLRVLCPKHDCLTPLKRHIHLPPIKRIIPNTIPLGQTIKEPLGIKGRNIR